MPIAYIVYIRVNYTLSSGSMTCFFNKFVKHFNLRPKESIKSKRNCD